MAYNPKEFLNCLEISKGILNGRYDKITSKASHFYNPKKMKEPYWAKHMVKLGRIENSIHLFYRER
jgi:hypothetical protein